MMHEAATMAAADDDWRSGAAAILDSYEDATWDEMRQQDESMAAISSASPVKSPDMFVHTLNTSDGKSPIRGEEQAPVSPFVGAAGLGSQLDAVWAAGVANQPSAKAENLYLKAEIQQQAMWKLHLYRILESRPEMDGPRWAQQFQQSALGGAEALRMQLDRLDEYEAAQVFGFHPLTELDLTRVILDNNRTMGRVQNRVEGSVMECVFTKKFTGLNVAELMQKTWANDMRLDRFKKVKCETSRLEVLQQINPNAYVLGRDVISPTDDISTFRSVFVRFLIETSRKIPANTESMATPTYVDASSPSTPPMSPNSDSESEEPMLEATGYVLGTQSVDIDGSHLQDDTDEKLAWAHLSLSIEFLNVVNPATGEAYQQLRWTGRTDYRGEEHAHRNAGDTLQGMLRWELLTIAPALNLVSLSLE
ncbi:hypothetical protein JG688_00011761 [Phytophthora aleatoria]|uniref:Uncharacterized protein n=1 Tax=Phytophthora aleatoria TaxID=2496075 RepID=A0A8J5INT3_9STRA|nr:hypothetical protein JG688_00011761 [Phytophthora aleatoria]